MPDLLSTIAGTELELYPDHNVVAHGHLSKITDQHFEPGEASHYGSCLRTTAPPSGQAVAIIVKLATPQVIYTIYLGGANDWSDPGYSHQHQNTAENRLYLYSLG